MNAWDCGCSADDSKWHGPCWSRMQRFANADGSQAQQAATLRTICQFLLIGIIFQKAIVSLGQDMRRAFFRRLAMAIMASSSESSI